jgi:hypothetical protein
MATNILQIDDEGEVSVSAAINQVPSMLLFVDSPIILKYFFHLLHPGSVLYGLELKDRIKKARLMLDLPKADAEYPKVLKAIADYESTLEADISFRMLRATTTNINSLADYFSNVDFEKTIQSGNMMGKPVHDPNISMKGIEKMRGLLRELQGLKVEVLENMKIEEAAKTRGAVKKSALANLIKK